MARPVYWTEEDIIRAIRSWERKYGHRPAMGDWVECLENHPSTSTVLRRYGRWTLAMQAAGVPS